MANNVRGWRAGAGAVVAAVAMACMSQAASAQGSAQRTVTVPFATATASDGYVSASMAMDYVFIACQGEVHIAYSLDTGSLAVGTSYRLGDKTYPVTSPPPQPASIHFGGTVYRGPATVGSFADGLAGRAAGMGCFSGQTQRIARIADVLGPTPSASQVASYLDSLSLRVNAGQVLRNASQESSIRSELRRAEAEQAAAARKREEEAQAKARQEAAAQRATASAAEAAPDTAQAGASPASTGNSQGSAPAVSSPPRPLSQEERIARAIASDKVLAGQRLEEQRAAFARQQASMAEAQQRQNEAVIAAAPQLMELGASLENAVEAWDARRAQRAYQQAQALMAGKCRMANGMAAPKDGLLQFGVPIRAKLEKKRDCGNDSTDRYKAFKFELPQPTRVRFSIENTGWYVDKFQIDVRDIANVQQMFLGWQEWTGWLQRSNSKTATLPAGVYIVTVSNGVSDYFFGFDLRVDAIDARGNAIAVAAPAPSAPRAAAAPSATTASVATAPAATSPRAAGAPAPGVGATQPTAGTADRRWGVLAEMAERDFHFGDLLGKSSLIAYRWEDPGRQMSRVDGSPILYRKTLYTLDEATGEIVVSYVGYDNPKYQSRLTAAADGSLWLRESKVASLSRGENGGFTEGKATALVPDSPGTGASKRAAKLIAAGKLRAANPGLRAAGGAGAAP